MKTRILTALVTPLFLGWMAACKERTTPGVAKADAAENMDAGEQSAAAKIKAAEDPVLREIVAFRGKSRAAYNSSRFDELEKIAAEARASKALFGNGSWKIFQFYQALACHDKEPESMWQLHDQIHEAWIAAKPDSITARVAHADFLVEYAWHARGNGYANTVTPKAWKTFGIRLGKAAKILENARTLEQKDPYFWNVALTIGKGQSWEKPAFDAMVAEAAAFEPKFFAFDVTRASTLLPRWYGEPGDWEAYAQQASERPNGLGAEVYARIVMSLRGYHDNVFRDSKASWPRTKEGLQLMRKRYPDSLEIRSVTALMATIAEDREFAKESFDLLGDAYLPDVWRKPERFTHYRHWAETGEW